MTAELDRQAPQPRRQGQKEAKDSNDDRSCIRNRRLPAHDCALGGERAPAGHAGRRTLADPARRARQRPCPESRGCAARSGAKTRRGCQTAQKGGVGVKHATTGRG